MYYNISSHWTLINEIPELITVTFIYFHWQFRSVAEWLGCCLRKVGELNKATYFALERNTLFHVDQQTNMKLLAKDCRYILRSFEHIRDRKTDPYNWGRSWFLYSMSYFMSNTSINTSQVYGILLTWVLLILCVYVCVRLRVSVYARALLYLCFCECIYACVFVCEYICVRVWDRMSKEMREFRFCFLIFFNIEKMLIFFMLDWFCKFRIIRTTALERQT